MLCLCDSWVEAVCITKVKFMCCVTQISDANTDVLSCLDLYLLFEKFI